MHLFVYIEVVDELYASPLQVLFIFSLLKVR